MFFDVKDMRSKLLTIFFSSPLKDQNLIIHFAALGQFNYFIGRSFQKGICPTYAKYRSILDLSGRGHCGPLCVRCICLRGNVEHIVEAV